MKRGRNNCVTAPRNFGKGLVTTRLHKAQLKPRFV
jgi:hypothetical protein